jgi:ferredoxin-type protein NapH
MKRHSIHTYRRIIQITVAITFIILPLLNQLGFTFIWGNFLNTHIGPLTLSDPLAVLQVTLKNQYFSPRLLMSAGIILIIAMCFGTIFCSWICPFGLLSELVHGLAKRVLPNTFKKLNFQISGFRIKLYILSSGLLFFFLFCTRPIINQLSMPLRYSQIFQYLFIQKHISFAVLFVAVILFTEFISRNRLWCRYICPQSFLLVIAKLLNPFHLKVGYRKEKCIGNKNNNPCQKACSLSLDPRTLNNLLIVACKKLGKALNFQFGRHFS